MHHLVDADAGGTDRYYPPPSNSVVCVTQRNASEAKQCPKFKVLRPNKASFSGSDIDTVIKTENLKTRLVECHGDDTPLTFHDTPLSYLLILLIHVSKFNIHDISIILPLKLA